MACPYCRSRKVREEYTVQTYDLKEDRTGKRKVFCTKGSYLTGNPPQVSENRARPLKDRLIRIFRRH